MMEENSNRLRKKRNLFQILNKAFSKFHSPSEHLIVDEVIFFLKEGKFSDNTKYIPKKHGSFGITIYKTCDQTVYSTI